MKRPGSRTSLLFRLIVPACAVFIVTILIMIASVFGTPPAPVAQWLDRHLGTVLTVEFTVIMVLALLAMTVDRVRTLKSGHVHRQTEHKETQIVSQPPSVPENQS